LDDDGDEVGVEGVGGGFGGKRVHVERSLVWVWGYRFWERSMNR
jgi:hypothetical protein